MLDMSASAMAVSMVTMPMMAMRVGKARRRSAARGNRE